MAQGLHLRKYGVETTFNFELYEIDGVDLRVDAAHASGDTKIMKDEGDEANTSNGFTDEGQGYSIVLDATEMSAARIALYVVDSATKVWLDKVVYIETYGNASAMHAFDLDTATQDVNAVQISGDSTAADNLELDYDGTGYAKAASTIGTATAVTNQVTADATAISGDSTAADNLELMYDGTGYTDDTAPASRSQVDGIGAASGGALNFANEADNVDSAIKSITFDGVETSGTNASVNTEDGVYHVIDDVANNIDIVYQFDVGGGRTATEITWKGYLSGNNNEATIQAYNGSGWDTMFTIGGKAGSTNDTEVIALLSTHTGTGADLGKVFVRLECAAQSNPTLNTDQLLVAGVNIGQSIGYAGGAIWVDTSASNTSTEAFVDGVADNPVSTWAAALTLSAALSITRFQIAAGSSITLSANSDGYTVIGNNWTLALGGQSIVGAYFEGASVTGIASGTGTTQIFDTCIMGASSHVKGTHLLSCGIAGTFTVAEAGDFFWDRCHSGIAGTSTPSLDFGAAIGNTNMNIRNYSGGVQFESMGDTGTDTASVEGRGQFKEGTCTGGTVAIRGLFTTSGVTNLTLSDNARIDTLQINTEVDTGLSDAIGTAGAGLTDLGGMSTAMKAEVNVEAKDVLVTDTYAEPAQGAPGATISIEEKISWIYTFFRNLKEQTSDTQSLYADDGVTVIAKAAVADDTITGSKAEWVTGP